MKKTIFHYTEEQLRRYIIDVYDKNSNGEWVLLPYEQIDTDKCSFDVVNGKVGYWFDRNSGQFSELNMDFNSTTCNRCYKINRTYQKDYYIVSNEKILEFTIGDNYYYIQKQTCNKRKDGHKWWYTINDRFDKFHVTNFSYTKKGIMKRFDEMYKKHAIICPN